MHLMTAQMRKFGKEWQAYLFSYAKSRSGKRVIGSICYCLLNVFQIATLVFLCCAKRPEKLHFLLSVLSM
jgi:hypothetical protein